MSPSPSYSLKECVLYDGVLFFLQARVDFIVSLVSIIVYLFIPHDILLSSIISLCFVIELN